MYLLLYVVVRDPKGNKLRRREGMTSLVRDVYDSVGLEWDAMDLLENLCLTLSNFILKLDYLF